MTIGSRIRSRRLQLGMTQDELAKKLGYESRTSINKIEHDTRNLTQQRIADIAKALETTPSYIMGWQDPSDAKIIQNQGGDVMPKLKATVADNRNKAVQRILCGQMAVKQFTATDVTRRMSNPMSDKTLREKLKNPGAFRLAELWDIAAVLGIDKETLKSVI